MSNTPYDSSYAPAAHSTAAPAGESWTVRIAGWVIGVLLGVVFGMLGTVVSQATLTVFGATLPSGLLLAVAGCLFLLLGLRLALTTRLMSLLAAAGLVGTVALLTLPSTGGSILVPANVAGYVWTFAPTVISLIVLAWPRLHGRPRPE